MKSKTVSSNRLSPLIWVGGKRWQVSLVEPWWRAYRESCVDAVAAYTMSPPRFVEPFCGGASMSFGLQPQRGVLNDRNEMLVNFHRQMREGFTYTDDDCLAFKNTEEVYYAWRTWYNEFMHDPDQCVMLAKVFYYLNQTCRCGMYRVNKAGKFNVPYGHRSWDILRGDLRIYQPVMHDWLITCDDFHDIKTWPTDFIYADPPYDSEFTTYTEGGFTWNDQQDAAYWLSQHSGPVVTTNQDTARIQKLYKSLGFTITYAERKARLRSKTGSGGVHQEVIMTKNLSMSDGSLFS